MMRSMFTAVAGLRVHQTKMDVIANNIANVNTVGYKASRVTFADMFSQTIQGASGANPISGRGGTNTMQIGLGSTVASIDKLMMQGASQRTDSPFDLMIQGDSFFIVNDGSGQYFTRSGAFNLDNQGNLVNSAGMRVQGWQAIEDPANKGQQIIEQGALSNIEIGPDKEYVSPTSTSTVNLYGNLNPEDTSTVTRSISFFDSIGNKYTVDIKLEYEGESGGNSEWSYTIGPDAFPNGDRDNPIANLVTSTNTGTIQFDTNGNLVSPAAPSEISIDLDSSLSKPPSTFGDKGSDTVTIQLGDLTQYVENTSVKSEYLDGNSPGVLNGVAVGSDGKIIGRYSNGDTKILAQIAVANFKNPAGLESVGNNLYVTTPNSGWFDGIGEDVQSGGGSMQGGVLEMSNVDLSSEFTEMITTQRGFQANSRVITTSDDMLQELVNLKR